MAAMPLQRHLAALALLLAGCAQAPERVVERDLAEAPPPRDPAQLRRVMMGGHDRARAEAGVPPLTWDSRLAASARTYAEEMARTGRFAHADQPHGPMREGENLWTGTRGAYRYDEMIGHWIAERRDFVNGVTPAFSRTGKWQDVSHYTQIVWRNTTRVGCAMTSNKRDDFLVCRYSPSGNVVGERTL
ncbi:CAP domain-containing protein [Sphingomonas jeddahensis]|nr:CAP domain-containing protein [Sphingomonas jeddahensis]